MKAQAKVGTNAKDILHIYASLGDMKIVDYKNTLAVATLVQLLTSRGIITENEFRETAMSLDALSLEMPLVAVEEPAIAKAHQEMHP